jgi:hypothetical protein
MMLAKMMNKIINLKNIEIGMCIFTPTSNHQPNTYVEQKAQKITQGYNTTLHETKT